MIDYAINLLLNILKLFGLNYILRVVMLGAILIGIVAGMLSVFFVLRKRSILGDAISHSTLAGVTVAFFIIRRKDRTILLLAAIIAGLLAIAVVYVITERTKLKEDAAIGISLSIFFAIGIGFLTYLQNIPTTAQAGLMDYLFGNLTYLTKNDLRTLTYMVIIIIITTLLFWKEFKVFLFDKEYAKTLGIPVNMLELLLMVLVATAIVLGIEMIGAVLMAGLLIAPAVAARQWTNKLAWITVLAAVLAAASGIMGTIFSANTENLPPGPLIVIIMAVIVGLSVIFGSKNGLLHGWLHRNVTHRGVNHEQLLTQLEESAQELVKRTGLMVLEFDISHDPKVNAELLNSLSRCGYCKRVSDERCAFTYKGLAEIQKLLAKEEKS